MTQIKSTIFALTLVIAASATLFASEIYKSIDADGNVRFSDVPTVGSEHLAIRSRPTDPARVQAQVQSRSEAQTPALEDEANAPQGPTPEEKHQEALEREEKCNQYRKRQARFTQNRRIYKMENGERVYYDEEQMSAARADLDARVRKYCN